MPGKMRTTLISALSVVFIFAGMAFAKTMRVDIIYHAKVGKSLKLKPGHYRINVASNMKSPTVKFYNKYGKFVGQVPVKVASISRKNSQTEVDYNTVASNDQIITEISPEGWSENLYFTHSKTSKSSSK